MAEHLKGELGQLIADRFTDGDGKRWSQTRIAEALGLSQTQVSDMLSGSNAGVTALLAISKASGKSINALLGPTAPQPVEYDADAAKLVAGVESLLEAFKKQAIAFGPKSPVGAALVELQGLMRHSPYRANEPTLVVPHHGAKKHKPTAILDPMAIEAVKPKKDRARKAG